MSEQNIKQKSERSARPNKTPNKTLHAEQNTAPCFPSSFSKEPLTGPKFRPDLGPVNGRVGRRAPGGRQTIGRFPN